MVRALGGSTNALLQLLAMANSNNFTRSGKLVPKVAEMKPSGKYRMTELIEAGGIHPLM